MRRLQRLSLLASFVTAVLLSACGGSGDDSGDDSGSMPTTPSQPVPVGDTVALTASGKVISFNRSTPATLIGSVPVVGLMKDETLLGADYRQVDGKLYGISNQARVYLLDPATGLATAKATMTPAIGDNQPYSALKGTRFSLGFDPAADRLRVVSDSGQNLHINVDSGATVTDAALHGATATIHAVAYTNALPGAVSTKLYGIDASTATVYRQDTPNEGTLGSPVPLGSASGTAVQGFSIDARNNRAYAALSVGGSTHLYTVPLADGGDAAADLGLIGSGEALVSIALSQPTVITVVALHADGLAISLFDAATPNTLTSTVAATGLDAGETLLGFDYRPKDRKLYALTSLARIVVLDTASGAATPVSTLAADPADDTAPFAGLDGTRFAVDFDPVEDRLRVISDTGANLHIDVDTGLVVTDNPVDEGMGYRVVVAAAYGSSYAGARGTTLYDLVTNNEVIATQSPTDGTLTDLGPTGYELNPGAAMDIAGGDDGLVLVAAQIVPDQPWVLFTQSFKVEESGRGDLYRNARENYLKSVIGGPNGPALIDIAIQPL